MWVDTVYAEDIYVGYRYFETFAKEAAYPFGYGLSYTSFQILPGHVQYDQEKGLSLSAVVTNTGDWAGKETVQIYLKKPEGVLEQPDSVLIGFEKTRELQPDESQVLEFTISVRDLTSYDEERAAYIMEAGVYEVYIGRNVADKTKAAEYKLRQDVIVRQAENRMQPVSDIRVLSRKDCESWKESQSGTRPEAQEPKPERVLGFYPYVLNNEDSQVKDKLTFADVQKEESLLGEYVSGLDLEDLARLAVCSGDGWGMEGTGEAGRLHQLEGQQLPRFIVADGNSGVNLKQPNIGMPSGVTICASFNKELAKEIGRVIGEEAKELEVDLILAPAFNIHRNPLCGRQPEYFSEDPYLSGMMAASYCRGLENTGVGGCYKHLMANNAETSRKRNQSIMSERALREIYFKTFEIALEEYAPVSVMTAYNSVNGVQTSADADLLLGILRQEMKYQGFVMTDWGSYDSVEIEKIAAAGNTWITPGCSDDTFTKPLIKAVEEGHLDIRRLRDNIYYFLKVLLQLNRA